MLAEGVKPWELLRYTWADCMKLLLGVQQRDEGLRRAAYIIHCSLIPKKDRADISEIFPLPFDTETDEKTSTLSRLKQRQFELRKKQNNA